MMPIANHTVYQYDRLKTGELNRSWKL